MRVEHESGVRALTGAGGALTAAADGLTDEALLAPSRCAGWSRVDALAHVHLGLQEMLLGVVSPTSAEPDTDAASYWRTDPPSNDDSADAIDQLGYLHRLSSAYRRPRGLVGHLRVTADGLTGAVERMPAGTVRFQGHRLATGDFLATWATELAVHHLDLRLDDGAPGPDPDALTLARQTAEALAGQRLDAPTDTEAVLRGWGRLS